MANVSTASASQHQYPSRVKTFCRQNQNNPRRLTLIPLLYMFLAICYIYGLLFQSVSSSKLYANKDGSISDSPTEILLEPQSLSHVAISNAEVLWKKRVQREDSIKRRDQMKNTERQKILEELQKRRVNVTDAITNREQKLLESNDPTMISINNGTNGSSVNLGAGPKHFRSTPIRRISRGKGSPTSTGKDDTTMPFVLVFTFFTIFRICFSLAIQRFGGGIEDDDEQQPTDAVGGTFWTRRQLRRRARAQIRQREFQNFVDRLNTQRVENGERPITADSLRLVVSDRDFNGNDYDRLWQFHEENGPAIGSMISSIGATEAEIGRCPSRVVEQSDDLDGQSCSVCLEAYKAGDEVRTIPCFHTFHTGCIDPWLAERAECPICKHSAIG